MGDWISIPHFPKRARRYGGNRQVADGLGGKGEGGWPCCTTAAGFICGPLRPARRRGCSGSRSRASAATWASVPMQISRSRRPGKKPPRTGRTAATAGTRSRSCGKLGHRLYNGPYRPQFHALLAAGRPKQNDSSRFCSHTVQAPEGEHLPEPQHSLEPPDCPPHGAEGLKAADPRHRPLDPEMVALDPLLQVLG
jgi:hypothetical protein